MSRRLLLVGNWKMSPDTMAGAIKLFTDTVNVARVARGVTVIVCPPTIWLLECKRRYRGKMISLGAQDVSGQLRGSHTGEVSAAMLSSAGIPHVIIGHSERRAAGENSELVHQKVQVAISSGLKVILCIGEKSRDEGGEYLHVLRTEIISAFAGVTGPQLSQIIIAYEPIWAIGRSAADAMKPDLMHETSLYIRKIIAEKYGFDQSRLVPILYGGSVEPANAEALLDKGEIDGFLVGHASLDPDSFAAILKIAHVKAKSRV